MTQKNHSQPKVSSWTESTMKAFAHLFDLIVGTSATRQQEHEGGLSNFTRPEGAKETYEARKERRRKTLTTEQFNDEYGEWTAEDDKKYLANNFEDAPIVRIPPAISKAGAIQNRTVSKPLLSIQKTVKKEMPAAVDAASADVQHSFEWMTSADKFIADLCLNEAARAAQEGMYMTSQDKIIADYGRQEAARAAQAGMFMTSTDKVLANLQQNSK